MNRSIEEAIPAVMLGSAAKSKKEFHHRLESLRGVAALMVAGWHSFLVFQPPDGPQWAAFTSMGILFNGIAAVNVFFVLSGLVLGLSLERSKESFGVNYARFCVRRVLRICPAHWVALLVITGAILSLNPAITYPAGVTPWFKTHWSFPITRELFLKNALFRDSFLNVPTWTLWVEMVCSFLLPLLVFISQRLNGFGRAIFLALLITACMWADVVFLENGDWKPRLYLFYLGYLVPTFGSVLVARLGTSTLLSKCVPWFALAIMLSWESFGSPSLGPLIEGVMASVFISFLFHDHQTGWFRVFDWPIARVYGKISYSFYLYHMVSLYLVVKAAIRSIPTQVLMAQPFVSCLCFFFASTAVATLLGWLSYRAVESPAIRCSKALQRILRPKCAVVMPGRE